MKWASGFTAAAAAAGAIATLAGARLSPGEAIVDFSAAGVWALLAAYWHGQARRRRD